MRKQGANFAVLSSRGWKVPDLAVSCPRKGFQNHWFWLRSFLPFFRRRKKGSRRRQDRSREARIVTASVRTGFAMTWFLHEVRCKPGFRSSGRPTPVRRLPIDLRRAACPHAALRQTQRLPPVPPGQHKRRARRGWRRRDDAKARCEFCSAKFAWLESSGSCCILSAKRIPKPLVLAAFFPPFLSPQKEREPPEARPLSGSADCHGRGAPSQ